MSLPELEDKLQKIELRLSAIEKILNRIDLLNSSFVDSHSQEHIDDAPEFSNTLDSRFSNLITKVQGNWLGYLAVICFVFAGIFIIKLSIDSGWITPEKRVIMSALFGVALIFSRFAFVKFDREYAAFLPAAGVIILYLTALASYKYYYLISLKTVIFLIYIISAICIWLYTQIKYEIYVIISAVGVYLSSIFFLDHNSIFAFYYFLLCSITFAIISLWARSRVLAITCSYLAVLMIGLHGFNSNLKILASSILILHFLIFSLETYIHSRLSGKSLSKKQAQSFLIALLIFYSIEYNFLSSITPTFAPWISLSFAFILIGLYRSAKNYLLDTSSSQYLIIIFSTIIFFHSFYLEILTPLLRSYLFVAIVFILSFYHPSRFILDINAKSFASITAISLVITIEYASMLSHLLFLPTGIEYTKLIVIFFSIVSIWVFIIRSAKSNDFILGAVNILAILLLWRLTNNINSFIISISWLLYAVSVMLFAYRRQDQKIVQSSVSILVLAAVKALLYDTASSATLVRIFCLLITGAVLYACGLILRKTYEWRGCKPLSN